LFDQIAQQQKIIDESKDLINNTNNLDNIKEMIAEMNRKDKIERQAEKEQEYWDIMEMFEELDPEEDQEMLIMKYDKLQKAEAQKNLDDIEEMIDELEGDEAYYNDENESKYDDLDEEMLELLDQMEDEDERMQDLEDMLQDLMADQEYMQEERDYEFDEVDNESMSEL
jgi:GTP-binding protein EngB required for normal cell division